MVGPGIKFLTLVHIGAASEAPNHPPPPQKKRFLTNSKIEAINSQAPTSALDLEALGCRSFLNLFYVKMLAPRSLLKYKSMLFSPKISLKNVFSSFER